jgi:hypothetical protein
VSQLEYQRVCRELCTLVDIPDWESIAQMQHIDINGYTIGLIFDEVQLPEMLCIYIALDACEDVHTLQQFLQANLMLESCALGYYAMHSETHQLVYRAHIALKATLNARDLLRWILACLDYCQETALAAS